MDPKVVVPVILGALLGTHSGALALNDAQSSPTLADSAQPSTSGNGTRLARLQDALQTIAAYRLRFWQTGDQQSMLPQLHVARDQANDAYRAFLSQGDAAHSAQSLIALADIDRMLTAASPNIMQEQQQPVARMYENARQLAMQAKDPALEFKAINGLIRTDLNSRNYDAATRHLNALLAIAPTTRSPDDLLNAYDMASQIDIEMGDLAGANDQLDRAVAMSGQIRDPSNLYYVYSDRADVYYSRFQQCNQNAGSDICTKAAELGFEDSRRAIDIATRAGYGNLAAQAQSRLAEMKTLRGAQSALAETQQKLLALKFRITKPSQVAIAPHFTQPENPALAAALRAYENRVGLAGRVNVYDPTNYDTEGRIDELEGRNDAALQNYRKAVSYLEQDRRKLGGSRANGDPLGDRIEIYYDAAREFLERKEYPQAFQMLELSRSRAMSEMLESRKLSLRVPQDQELYSEAVALNSMLAGKQSELFDLARSEQSSARAKDLQMAIDELQARKRTLNDRIARQSPTLLDLVDHTQVASLASLQASARRGNYDVLYYLSLASGVIVWHIDAESVQVINVFYSGSLLADRTQALYDSASDANKSLDESAARELFLVLVNPLLQFAKTKHLVVIAHGPLNSLPFQLLKDPAGSYLGEGYAITYAPSATVLIGLGKPPNIAQGQLLAVANPRLGNAREEVKALGGLYPGRSKIVADTFATKQEVAGWIQDHNLIHLSVHGVFKSGEPLLSYLELRPHDADDGHLTAADMFGLHFQNNSLVVLSACETGRVEVTRSNEVLGMERGLLYAGASYLVMSSWRVDAAATELWMTTFYREAQTKPPNAAGRLALLAVKNDPKYQSPFFWAPFKMTGE